MKKIILSLLFILSIAQLKAQSFEISAQANMGLSHFTGAGTVSSTFLNANDDHSGYPNGDGNKNAPVFGVDIQWQYTAKSNFILGLQTGYEALGSKVDITSVGYPGTPANGTFTDHLNYINLNPYIGYRLKLTNVRLDILPGFDLAFGANGKQSGKAVTNANVTYTASNVVGGSPRSDVCARIGLAAYYQKFGITASYSHGLTDFNSGALADAPVPSLHFNVLRIGLSYRIK